MIFSWGEFSKKGVEGVAWFLLAPYSKMWGSPKELFSENEWDLEDLENYQPIHIAKNEKVHSGKNTNSVAGQSFD